MSHTARCSPVEECRSKVGRWRRGSRDTASVPILLRHFSTEKQRAVCDTVLREGHDLGMKLTALLLVLVPVVGHRVHAQSSEELARGLSLPVLDQLQLPAWREFVRPGEGELAHERIGWLGDFASGIRASQAQQKPLLFWAMNGHPLGCT